MRPRHLLVFLPALALLSPTARGASATPPDKQGAAPAAPAHADTQRATEIKPTAEAQAYAAVERQLVKPLAQREAKQDRFSRDYVPPQARRVRVTGHQPSPDGRGAEFVAFAIDERSALILHRKADDAEHWRQDAIVGCVYPARDEVFIKRGDKYFGAVLLLGRRTSAADETVCRPALTRTPSGTPTVASAPQVVATSGARK
jgi:hypothetical protein